MDKDRWDNSGDDDDIIVNEMSDDETEDTKNSNNAAIVELLSQMIPHIKALLEKDSLEPISQ